MEPDNSISSSISKGKYDLNSALDTLFASILSHLAETDVFGHSDSPSIFIVYAHDNEQEGAANAWCVALLIEWLKAIRSRTVSDKAPLPLWSPRAGGSESTRNILSNQLCLLPCTETPGDTGIIDRVNKVVVFGSEVLKRYYENEFTPSYIDAIVAAYQDPQDGASGSVELTRRIRNVVEANCSHFAFHHVLTELGFLKLRSIYTKDSHGVIPVALDQDLMSWLPFRDNCDLVIKAKSLNMPDLHQLFFKILEQIYVEEHVLIKQCKECYSQASGRFRREPWLSESRRQQIIDQEIGKTQTVLRGLESAAFRNQRRDIQQLDSNQLHHNTNKNFRDIHASFKHLLEESASIKTHIDGEKLENMLEWLSGCPFRLHHQSVSRNLMPGSGQWLVNHPTYQHWVQSDSSSMVLLRGVRGCGKSSLFSVVVDQLLLDSQNHQEGPAVAFYYCSSSPSEPDRASPDAILRSILRQLAVDQEKKTVDPIIWSEYQKVADAFTSRSKLGRLGTYGCIELLLKLATQRATYLALDAIDELQEADRFELIQAFQRIIDESTGLVKVLLTSRNDAQIDGLLQSASTIRVSPAENQGDVEAFVAAQLERIVRSRRLLNGSPSKHLMKRLRETLTTGAQEMFLWVQLQIEVLCRKKTEHDIFTALEAGLSENLDKIYANTYQSFLKLDRTARSVVQSVISWILYAKSSLTIEALRRALKLSPELSQQSSDLELPDLFDVCHNLVVLDPAMNILRLCHPSARDFMQRQTMFSEISGNRLLAETCLEQCSRGPDHVSQNFSGTGPISDLALYAGLYWPHHLKLAQLSLLTTDEAFQAMDQFVFDQETADLNIAFVWWLEWMTQALEKLPPYHSLRKTHECLTSPEGPSPLFSACVFGLDSLLDMTLSNMSGINLEQLSETGHTPLYLASTFGHASVVSTLIDHGADADVTCGSYGNPLHAACFRGHLGVVKTLLGHGVSPRTASKVFKNALHAACEGSRADIANLLIKNHGVIQDGQDYDDALQRTTEAGFRDAIEYLMGHHVAREFGRDAGVRDHDQNLILATIKKGQTGILQYLLSKPGMAEKLPEDAMAIAAVHGHIEMLDLLNERGVNVEAEGEFGSALRSACLQGHIGSVRKLLQMGANPRRSGRRGDSLQAAASKGYVEIIKLLISNGAMVDQPGKPCGTCIQAAAYYGHGAAVELLIQEGAEIYSEGKFKDALDAAVQGGHQDIASFLQENYAPSTKRAFTAIARGDYTEPGPTNGLGNQDRSSSLRPQYFEEEQGIDNEEAEASIEDLSTIRQELQADEVAEEDVSEALMLAVGKGDLQVTELLLEEALRHTTSPGLLKQIALCEAAKHKHPDCFQLLADSLERTVNMTTWASALKAAAMTGDESIAAEVLDLRTIGLPPGLSYHDSIPTDEPYRLARANFPWDHDSNSPPSTTSACREAIEVAVDSGQHQIASLVWDWVLMRGPEMLEARFHDWEALTAASARLADFAVFEACFALLGKCIDYAERSEESPHDLLLDSGIDTVALILSSQDNNIRLNADQVTEGVEAAAASGHGRLCLDLIHTLFLWGDEARENEAVIQALLTASRAGKSAVIRYLLDHTEIHCQDDFTTYMTHALVMASLEQRQISIVRLVLDHVTDVVQDLLENGAADDFTFNELGGLILRATERRTRASIPIILQLLHRGALLPPTDQGSVPLPILGAIGDAIQLLSGPEGGSSEQFFNSDEPARELMNNGMRELIQIMFRRLPRQTASINVFGELLHMAAIAGDLSTVRLLIKQHVDVNYINMPNLTPLGSAAEFGHVQVIKALLKAGAKVHPKPKRMVFADWDTQEPAVRAITGGHASALKALLDGGVNPNLTSRHDSLLVLAAQRKSTEFMTLLLKYGADLQKEPLALITATQTGNRDMVKVMLDAGADVNAMGIYGEPLPEKHLCSPLYVACEEGHLQVALELLGRGADASLDVGNRDGLPLVVAARHGHLDIVEALLERGASPTRRSKGIEAAPIKFPSRLAKRDVMGDSPGPPPVRWKYQDTIMDKPDYMCFLAEGKVYPNAIESACTGQKGAQVSLQILNTLLQTIRSDEELQVACWQATQIVTDNRNSTLLEGLLPYIAPAPVGLDYACRCGSVEVVQSMLEQGVNVNATLSEDQVALQLAIDYGHLDLVQFLATSGANLKGLQDQGLPLNFYCLVASVIESYAFITPKEQKSITKLELAVESLLQIAQYYLPSTQQDQEFLDRSLILACHVGSVEMAWILFKIGAKLDSVTDLSRHIPDYYPSPALAAIECNQPHILKCLLQWDSDPTPGVTMFHPLELALEACLGKTSPVLLQTFLEYAGSLNLSDHILLLAMEKETWYRPCGESDPEIILEFCPSLTPSEEVLVTLSAMQLQGPWQISNFQSSVTSTLCHSLAAQNYLKRYHLQRTGLTVV
ncbi:hypothetical protein CEP52_004148 [Fusarium oligoseptatum]|uniref:Nephrocystin 3-like N-terminal domain-containing protein n=1 Tax=Fusarium oligoseptatum TaxID=2604345 RepID=A0A428U4W7_9HYPO|nr:hypothetical protein CEP52_004148 [Fusarium oligoseptatum]